MQKGKKKTNKRTEIYCTQFKCRVENNKKNDDKLFSFYCLYQFGNSV